MPRISNCRRYYFTVNNMTVLSLLRICNHWPSALVAGPVLTITDKEDTNQTNTFSVTQVQNAVSLASSDLSDKAEGKSSKLHVSVG